MQVLFSQVMRHYVNTLQLFRLNAISDYFMRLTVLPESNSKLKWYYLHETNALKQDKIAIFL